MASNLRPDQTTQCCNVCKQDKPTVDFPLKGNSDTVRIKTCAACKVKRQGAYRAKVEDWKGEAVDDVSEDLDLMELGDFLIFPSEQTDIFNLEARVDVSSLEELIGREKADKIAELMWKNMSYRFFDSTSEAFIKLSHEEAHLPYCVIDVPPEAQKFVYDNLELSVSQIWLKMINWYGKPPFSRRAIYYLCSKIESQKWKRCDDELASARKLLDEGRSAVPNCHTLKPASIIVNSLQFPLVIIMVSIPPRSPVSRVQNFVQSTTRRARSEPLDPSLHSLKATPVTPRSARRAVDFTIGTPTRKPLDPVYRPWKAKLKGLPFLPTYVPPLSHGAHDRKATLQVLLYPAMPDGMPVPPEGLEHYFATHDFDFSFCWCPEKEGRALTRVAFIVPFSGEHQNDPCFHCPEWECSYWVNLAQLLSENPDLPTAQYSVKGADATPASTPSASPAAAACRAQASNTASSTIESDSLRRTESISPPKTPKPRELRRTYQMLDFGPPIPMLGTSSSSHIKKEPSGSSGTSLLADSLLKHVDELTPLHPQEELNLFHAAQTGSGISKKQFAHLLMSCRFCDRVMTVSCYSMHECIIDISDFDADRTPIKPVGQLKTVRRKRVLQGGVTKGKGKEVKRAGKGFNDAIIISSSDS
ncbi:hypothetical protein EW146_g7523 [Bondarzewia mesenterica]|uniref:Uncharacterized protein n=1 Tax=Bondarzewia mesenterica TaxID=1095465 RepID=A0A4S4LMC7_9AGAM|nr:hypothetical protein EW146_g7523 [Bondarzewia mesenterica]